MNLYPIFEAVLIALLVGWSLQKAWRTLVPAIRASLRRPDSRKACGSACGGCGSDGTSGPAARP